MGCQEKIEKISTLRPELLIFLYFPLDEPFDRQKVDKKFNPKECFFYFIFSVLQRLWRVLR
jgi:hypothetical protein